ncbi:uncharacterized protein LY79DRAFT_172039 [Colletotrichum navitas]|uniref:Uncharacterized protein n=1 Tax=Colletotrichum navitas TaxID=681940 RepID=A0AAD8V6Y5_9PEZI|nr:uncharacterized protein LY79DRAFT_172039 [Colletotrichum navitas]KAK1593840.1 hypothetical protein LY79DRAFT_172039 [Colletotrichum navitas]
MLRDLTNGDGKYMYSTLSMLKASMVSRSYRERILLIALRWHGCPERKPESLLPRRGEQPRKAPRPSANAEKGQTARSITYRCSVLDCAVATGQDEHFLKRPLQLGGPALSGSQLPRFSYWTFVYQESKASWRHFKEVLCPSSGGGGEA